MQRLFAIYTNGHDIATARAVKTLSIPDTIDFTTLFPSP